MVAVKTKKWDEKHTFYVDDIPGYYFGTLDQARKYIIDKVMKKGRRVKETKDFYYINIDRIGKKTTDYPYARVYYKRDGHWFLFKTVYNSNKPNNEKWVSLGVKDYKR